MFQSLFSNDSSNWRNWLWIALLIALFPGQILFGSIASTICVILAVVAFFGASTKVSWSRLLRSKTFLWFSVAFLCLVVPFFFTAEDPSDLKYILNFIAFPLAISVYFLARDFAKPEWAIAFAVAALSATLVAVIFAATEVNIVGMKRAQGFWSNANMLAHLAVLFGFMSVIGFNFSKSWWRYLFLAGPILGILVTLMAGSRGALLSALPLCFLTLLFLARNKGLRRWIFAGLAAGVLLIAGYFVLSKAESNPVNRIMRTSATITEVLRGETAGDWGSMMRIELYKGAIRAFTESPFVGHGWHDAVVVAASEIEGRRPATGRKNSVIAARWPNMHNDLLGFAAASGVFGIASYFALLIAPFLQLRRTNPHFATQFYAISSIVVVTIMHGVINAPFGHDLGVITYAFVIAIILGVFTEKPVSERESGPPEPAQT